VLVVEDYADLREILCRVLELQGYGVQPAGDGREALELFRSGSFDAVICDLGLPGMCGRDLVAQVRQLRPGTAVVVLTGLLTDDLASDAAAAGCDELLVKPLPSFKDLILALERALSRHRPAGSGSP
jgi:CheY-like chemotaxis protein